MNRIFCENALEHIADRIEMLMRVTYAFSQRPTHTQFTGSEVKQSNLLMCESYLVILLGYRLRTLDTRAIVASSLCAMSNTTSTSTSLLAAPLDTAEAEAEAEEGAGAGNSMVTICLSTSNLQVGREDSPSSIPSVSKHFLN
jgi:hypothetical protein